MEAEVVICCGMGGFLMVDLLKEAPYLPSVLVLQPQSGVDSLRRYVYELGYRPSQEMIVEDMGHIYEANTWIFDATFPSSYDGLSEDSLLWEVGAMLYEERNPLLYKKLTHLLTVEQSILDKVQQGSSLQAKVAKEKAMKRAMQIESLLVGWENRYEPSDN